MEREPLLLAIDGGQTSTKSLLAKLDGTIIARGIGSASDHFHIEGGIEKNRRALHGSIGSALSAAGATADQIVSAAFGLTGCPPPGPLQDIVFGVVREEIKPEQLHIMADYVTNLTGASAGRPGVVLIAGGGAIGYGVTVDGREAISSGYGFLLGDEGSAFKIGIGAIQHATRSADRRGAFTELEQVVRKYFDLEKVRDLPRVVYRAGFERDRISLLTPLVVATAEAGDWAAIRVLHDAGVSLGEMALGVVRQLFEPGETVDIFRTGGVFNIGALVLDSLVAVLEKQWPGASLRAPRFQPSVGGLIKAANAVGIATDEQWLAQIERTWTE